jgi:hypothetical protein
MINNSGVDKVRLFAPYDLVQIDKGATLEIQSKRTLVDDKEAPLLFVTSDGQQVTGNKAMLNTDKFNVTLVGGGVVLELNPSKPYHSYELVGTSELLIERIELVTNQLASYGISGAWSEASITRLDYAKNIKLNYALAYYIECMQYASFKRHRRQALYPDGFMSGNNTRGLIIYNKSLESNLSEAGITRVEYQLKKGDATKKIAGSYTDKDLVSNLLKAYDSYIEEVFSSVTLPETNEDIIPLQALDNGMKLLQQQFERNTNQYFEQLLGRNFIANTIGINNHLASCRDVHDYSEKQLKRVKKNLLEAVKMGNKMGLNSRENKGVEQMRLLNELKEALCL